MFKSNVLNQHSLIHSILKTFIGYHTFLLSLLWSFTCVFSYKMNYTILEIKYCLSHYQEIHELFHITTCDAFSSGHLTCSSFTMSQFSFQIWEGSSLLPSVLFSLRLVLLRRCRSCAWWVLTGGLLQIIIHCKPRPSKSSSRIKEERRSISRKLGAG